MFDGGMSSLHSPNPASFHQVPYIIHMQGFKQVLNCGIVIKQLPHKGRSAPEGRQYDDKSFRRKRRSLKTRILVDRDGDGGYKTKENNKEDHSMSTKLWETGITSW